MPRDSVPGGHVPARAETGGARPPRCHRCGRVLDSRTVLRSLAQDPVDGSATVLTACTPEHLQTLRESLLVH